MGLNQNGCNGLDARTIVTGLMDGMKVDSLDTIKEISLSQIVIFARTSSSVSPFIRTS